MRLKANEVSPRHYWGRKFTNTTTRKFIILCGYKENVNDLANSSVSACREDGSLVYSEMNWSMFLVSNFPAIDDKKYLTS